MRVIMIHDVRSYNYLIPFKYISYPNVKLIINSNYILITTVTFAVIATSEKKPTSPCIFPAPKQFSGNWRKETNFPCIFPAPKQFSGNWRKETNFPLHIPSPKTI